jgi:glycosyltransferase involved in cell wall biosynthesis
MRVALFIDTHGVGGAERVVVELAIALLAREVDVEVWHFGNAWLRDRLAEGGVPAVAISHETLYRRTATLPAFWKHAVRLLRERSISVLHSHLLGACFAWSVPSRWAGVDHVATLHDAYSLRGSWKAYVMVQLARAAGSRITGVSEEICEIIGRWGGSAPCEVVLNGIRPPRTMADRAAIRRGYGAADTDVVFVAVGRIVAVKRLERAILSFADSSVPTSARLWIVGEGPLRPSLEARVRELGLERQVRFLGQSDAVSELLAASDVVISTSDSEGLSMALIEGIAAGRPVLATAVGGNALIVAHGSNGFLTAVGDDAEIRRRIVELATGPALRESMGRSSRAAFLKTFDAAAMAQRYLTIYSGCHGRP